MGALGAVLGLSWASLGALLGHLGAILRPRMAIGSEKARKQNTLIFLRFWKDFGLLGGSLGSSLATWGRLGAVLGPLGASWNPLERSCAILSHLGGHLGLSEALLEPSWAILDVPTTREAPRPGPGEGVGGGVNLSPKGKKGVGRGSSLDHLLDHGSLMMVVAETSERPYRYLTVC